MRLARVYTPLREEGKASLSRAVDGGRAAARSRGRELVAEGIIPRVERGKYDLIRSVRGYVKYLQERAEGRGVDTGQKEGA